MPSIEDYLKALQVNLPRHFAPNQIYHGKKGAERLGRELGYGLGSYTEKAINNILGDLYSTLLVRFTFGISSGVPLSNKEFLIEVKKGIHLNRLDTVKRLTKNGS